MDKKKIIKTITIAGIIVIVAFLVWKIVLFPLIDFNKKEKQLTKAGENYFEKNPYLKPEEGEISTVTLETLKRQKYIVTMRTTYGKKECDNKNSWVKVKRKEGKYTYITNLKCGKMKSTVDNEGPVIKIKGNETVEVELGTEYVDEGVDSVYDNTDGKMNTKDVTVKSDVNTKKIGKYTVTYEAKDSLENKTKVERTVNVVQTLDKIVKKNTDKDNVYKGTEVNNYIEFSNMLFRIVGVNSDGSVKIVSDEEISAVNYKDINKWLNGYFYDHLTDKSKKYIVEKEFCSSKVDEKDIKTTEKCENKTKQKVGLLSAKDYNASAVDGKSYLFKAPKTWVNDYNSDSKAWTIRIEGNYEAFDNSDNYSIYPTINLKKNIKISKGNGTKNNPYVFSKVKSGKVGDFINTRYTGEYVKYAGTTYRIIDGNIDKNTKIVSVKTIEGTESHLSNDGTTTIYNPTEKGNVGYYIENQVSKFIKTDIFVKKEIEVPIYNNLASYSGKKETKKYSVKLSAPNMYEMFSIGDESFWFINSSKKKDVNYLINISGSVAYKDAYPSITNEVRVVGFLDEKVTILSGNGTIDKPYILQN